MGLYTPTGEYRSFKSTLLDGFVGEELFSKYLKYKGYTVIDRRDDYNYQELDIDFEFISPNGSKYTVEVKTDKRMAKTKNILVEESMDRPSGNMKGWLYKCEADFLCFVDINNYFYYLIYWKKLREMISHDFWKIRKFSNGTDGGYGYGYTIPIEDLKKYGLLQSVGRIKFS